MIQLLTAIFTLLALVLKQIIEFNNEKKKARDEKIKQFQDAISSRDPSALARAIDGLRSFDPRPSDRK